MIYAAEKGLHVFWRIVGAQQTLNQESNLLYVIYFLPSTPAAIIGHLALLPPLQHDASSLPSSRSPMASCPLPPVWPVFIFYLLAPLGQPSLTLPASSSRLPSPGLPSTAPARPESGFMAGSSASCPRSAWSALFSTLAAVSPEGPHLPASRITNSERLYLQPSPALGIPTPRSPASFSPSPLRACFPFSVPSPGTVRQPVPQTRKPAFISYVSSQSLSAPPLRVLQKWFSALFPFPACAIVPGQLSSAPPRTPTGPSSWSPWL